VRVINAAGYCVAHDPERPADMMRELGRRSGRSRREPKPERVHPSLRAYLKQEVAPSEVWAALRLAMEGANESARVSASKVLMDALSEPADAGGCRRCQQWDAELKTAAARFREKMADKVERRRMQLRADPLLALEELVAELRQEAVQLEDEAVQAHPDLIVGDVSFERADAIWQGLEEIGLVRRRSPEEQSLAEERAALEREREELAAQRAEVRLDMTLTAPRP
jgi:hypothetical protein